MAERVTRWSPDTCGCVVLFRWDDVEGEDARTHTFDVAETVCAAHSALPPEDVYEAILAENQAKNRAVQHITETFPSQIMHVIQPDGATARFWKTGSEPSWSFGAPDAKGVRALTLTTPGLTRAQRAQLASDLTARADILPQVEVR